MLRDNLHAYGKNIVHYSGQVFFVTYSPTHPHPNPNPIFLVCYDFIPIKNIVWIK